MIKEIAIKNFKSLKDIKLKLSNLNLLAGLNGGGKSSFIQTLLLLRQSYKNNPNSNEGLILQDGELASLGSGKDVFYQYAEDENIEFEILYNNNRLKWSFQYAPKSDILSPNEKQLNISLLLCNLFNSNFQYLNAEHISPQTTYKKSEFQVIKNNNIGIKGEYAAHYLAENYNIYNWISDDSVRQDYKTLLLSLKRYPFIAEEDETIKNYQFATF